MLTDDFVLLCLDFLAVLMAFVRILCGGKFCLLVLADSLPKLILGTLRYVKVPDLIISLNSFCTC